MRGIHRFELLDACLQRRGGHGGGEERKGEARPLVAPIRGKDSLACALTSRKSNSRLLEHVQ